MIHTEPKLRELIHFTIYSYADPNSQIPDVDQMAEYFHSQLQIHKVTLEDFTDKFIEFLAEESRLKNCFYEGVIDDLNEVFKRAGEVAVCSWTQGNVFLQAQKAKIFQDCLEKKLLAKPSIYASLDKANLLPQVERDLTENGCDLICLIDDRLPNVLGAKQILGDKDNLLFIHKIRPDKKIAHRITESEHNLFEIADWSELSEVLDAKKYEKVGFILDKDGIVYNTTYYRELLKNDLVVFLKSFL